MEMVQFGKAPIPGDTPQGNDPKYEPAYSVLQGEIRKLSSISAGAIEWSVVVTAATEVLSTIAKDIPAAAYLAVGLGQTEGPVGWARGTQICADILTEYWDTAFPPLARLRARTNSLDWWKERSLVLLEGWTDRPPLSCEEFSAVQAALDALDAQIAERLPDQPPLYDVREALRRVPVQPPPAEAVSIATSPVLQTDTTIQATPASTPPPSAGSPHSVTTLSDVYSALHQLAGATLNVLCAEEPTPDPLAWKIVYASLFGKFVALPPADAKTTAIPAPDSSVLTICRSHLEAGRALACISAAVSFAPACPLWLDVQRCIVEGLTAADAQYAGALSVVRHECASLLERLPELVGLTFADGTPFAEQATQDWLMTLASGESGSRQSAEKTLAGLAVSKAGVLSGQGNPAAALEVLEEAAHAVNGKDNAACLRLRAQQLRILCRETRFELAGNLAEDISAAVEHYGLDQWDPALALEVRQAVYTAFATLEGADGTRTREALRRVTRLSPAAALKVEI